MRHEYPIDSFQFLSRATGNRNSIDDRIDETAEKSEQSQQSSVTIEVANDPHGRDDAGRTDNSRVYRRFSSPAVIDKPSEYISDERRAIIEEKHQARRGSCPPERIVHIHDIDRPDQRHPGRQ
ncbi:hypothetical protein D3C76_1045180 [compost metagenome]